MTDKEQCIHPGRVLQEKIIQSHGLTQRRLAEILGTTIQRVNQIITGKRSITPDTALRLGKHFEITADEWIRMQAEYDLCIAKKEAEHE